MQNNWTQIFITGTDKCNLNCAYCANADFRKPERFDPAAILASVEHIYREHAGDDFEISISGGEPLLDMPLIHQILGVIQTGKVDLKVYTNGIMLSRDIDADLRSRSDFCNYVVGLNSQPEKSVSRFLANDYAASILDRVGFTYVVTSPEDAYRVQADIPIIMDRGMRVLFVYDYCRDDRAHSIVDTAANLAGVLRGTGYIPRTTRMLEKDCSTITVHRDGRISATCAANYPREYVEKFLRFKEVVCVHCPVHGYCALCYLNAVHRFGIGNYCAWVRALCVNVKGAYDDNIRL